MPKKSLEDKYPYIARWVYEHRRITSRMCQILAQCRAPTESSLCNRIDRSQKDCDT